MEISISSACNCETVTVYSECNQNLPEIGIYKKKPTPDSNGWSRYELPEDTHYNLEYNIVKQVSSFLKYKCTLFNCLYYRNG